MNNRPSPDRQIQRRTRIAAASLALACAVAVAHPATAQPVTTIGALPNGNSLVSSAKVIDLRDPDACLRGSLPAARCLPAPSLFDRAGDPVSFHALRWLLGTVGLNGDETVVVYVGGAEAASDNALDDAWATAALLYLAGQKRIMVYNGLTPGTLKPGLERSISRETVYTAPMRDQEIKIGATATSLRQQLIEFGRNSGSNTVTVAPNT